MRIIQPIQPGLPPIERQRMLFILKICQYSLYSPAPIRMSLLTIIYDKEQNKKKTILHENIPRKMKYDHIFLKNVLNSIPEHKRTCFNKNRATHLVVSSVTFQ